MGIENMRRWPMYIVFAVCILLFLSLFNSWGMETELRNEIAQISTQLKECSKQQSSCLEESLSLLEQREGYVAKLNTADKENEKLRDEVIKHKTKSSDFESQVNHTLLDVKNCKTELESLKNLQVSKTATLEALRFNKEQLTSQLEEKNKKIEDLEKDIEKLKLALTTKSVSSSSKVTPAQPPKQSPSLNAHDPLNEPVIENAAKEEMEDSNLDGNPMNDGNEFDTGLN